MNRAPQIVSLDDVEATDSGLTGAKAANLAAARRVGLPALPGVVLTTAWDPTDDVTAFEAWQTVSAGGSKPVVVRSSSTGEDGAASSMAGVFESVIGVADESAYGDALRTVLGSGDAARRDGLVDAPLAVLVQPMVEPRWGGVLFGADPVTGRHDRLVVAAVPGGPAALVGGEVDGWTAVLGRRGHVREVRSASTDTAVRPPSIVLRRLAKLAADVSRAYGGPQDIEWAIDDDGTPILLQARPITTLAPRRGTVFGPGPVAESFPEALAPLERDLWIDPLRDGLREALQLAGATSQRRLERSPIVIEVDGMVAADLETLGVDETSSGLLRRLDPRPPARRLRAAWRVGRLRAALPALGTDVVRRVDADLMAVPALAELSNPELMAVLDNSRQLLVSLHGYEALAGLLIPNSAAATTTGASLALSAVAQARAEGVSLCDLVERDPVVLALVPPRIGPAPEFGTLDHGEVGGHLATPGDAEVTPDPAAVVREALRLRVRWVQELTSRAAWELGRRLVDVRVLPTQDAIRQLRLDELDTAVRKRSVPDDLSTRVESSRASLPGRFRLTESGVPVAVHIELGRRARRRGGAAATGAVGAGGGSGSGPVHVGPGDVPVGSVLVVPYLDPRLAGVVPRLAGLVSETGSPLSHLAILAREHHVPIVVGLAGATERWAPGELVRVDGQAGTVDLAEPATTFSKTGASS